ncbi:IclR family transcriptional regulator [Coraliomargarita parva]|uniref:IclR family transcriptional regulator n=1 Tax=Coraliomargarita parva TaxID=3014050 RepID=UPI0022B39166|nr:helix-turn-helix domain-containing protein [Coraliomargarita parva]
MSHNTTSEKSFSQPNNSIIAGIECLQWLASSARPLGNAEVARVMGIDRNRANRILKTLVMMGIARQTADRKFSVGSGFHVLAAQSLYASGILRPALPVLESLNRYKCIVAYGVLWKDMVSYLYYHFPGSDIVQAIGFKQPVPALDSSIGRVLLAELDDTQVDALYGKRDLSGYGGLKGLKDELHQIRIEGFSRHAYHGKPDKITEAYPIRQEGKVVAAVALANFPEGSNGRKQLSALKRSCLEIEAALVERHESLHEPEEAWHPLGVV